MTLEPGTQFGAYEVVALIGKGGMGEVYRARDLRLKRTVALKIISASFGDPERIARFRREAELLASLNHPNIAAIYGLVDSGGSTAIALEFVEGQSLAERIRRGPLPANEAGAGAADRRGDRRGSRERHRPPRPEAGQHHRPFGWHRQGARLRRGKGRRAGLRRGNGNEDGGWTYRCRRSGRHSRTT